MESYVDRRFAKLDDLWKEMMKEARKKIVLFLRGPSGTGKTTTLQALYYTLCEKNKDQNVELLYIDAKYGKVNTMCTVLLRICR